MEQTWKVPKATCQNYTDYGYNFTHIKLADPKLQIWAQFMWKGQGFLQHYYHLWTTCVHAWLTWQKSYAYIFEKKSIFPFILLNCV